MTKTNLRDNTKPIWSTGVPVARNSPRIPRFVPPWLLPTGGPPGALFRRGHGGLGRALVCTAFVKRQEQLHDIHHRAAAEL